MEFTSPDRDGKIWAQGSSFDNISQNTIRPIAMSVPLEVLDRLDLARTSVVKNFGNPTPLALAGLILCLTPLSCQLMEWRGADGSGTANNGAHFFCGGVLMLLGGVLEFVLGNTFAFVVFGSYGGFFLSIGGTLAPGFGALRGFKGTSGGLNAQFYNTFAFFYLFAGLLSLVFLICSIRTNMVYVGIFLGYCVAFPLLAAEDWQRGQGNMDLSHRLQIAAGAACFVVSMLGWYAFLCSLLPSVDFPYSLSMGDLSGVIRGASEKKAIQVDARKGV